MDRFAHSMDRFAHSLIVLASLALVGCGSSEPEPVANQSVSPPAARQSGTVPPTDVVSQFLDEVRRGGEDSRAAQLLTSQARSELARIGRTVQPIGSPDARFKVTRFEPVPGDPDSALVHSLWSEPSSDGTTGEFQVVWAVQREQGQWRISGLAMELDPNEEPLIVDFENGALMAQILDAPAGSPAPAGGAAERQAALPSAASQRR